MSQRAKTPRQAAPYRLIYKPAPSVYLGPDTDSFKTGECYSDWIANDFTLIKDHSGCWHSFGITHPRPPCFIDEFHCDGNGHEAEFQLFHATWPGTLADLLQHGQMQEQEKILYPQQRPAEEPKECWAPCVVEKDDLYYLFYSPGSIRVALSKDLYHWQPKGSLFSGSFMLRDPYIFEENGIYTMIYVNDHLYSRTSTDLLHWGDEHLFQENPFPGSSQESPCLFQRNGKYYLMWCIHDATNGWYDNRTFIFCSDRLDGFSHRAPIGMVKGHATEFITENGEDYFLSVFYPQNGLNLAKVSWEEI